MWARTVAESVTLPSHTSMLTGVSPQRHGVLWNSDRPDRAYPNVPTLFEVAKRAGLTTAIVTGKAKFVALARPESVDWASVAKAGDDEVAAAAAGVIRSHAPDVVFVHFGGPDGAGHSKGWGTPQQLAAVEKADHAVGEVLRAIDDAKLADATLVILSADHGGAGRSHGPDDPRSRHIPWVAAGPGIRRNYDLTRDPTLVINTVDTFATVCYFLGLVPEGPIEGRPVLQVQEERELLQDVK
jgi:arylsulfatase A-like enzyme